MKTRKYHILCSWILLICFVAGQVVLYGHQHSFVTGNAKSYSKMGDAPHQSVTEKCAICDVMHHNNMVVSNGTHFAPVAVIGYVYKSFEYNFTSIQLILAGGRAPPFSNFG